MLEIAVMIEGQNGLTWPRWQNMVRLVEDLGFIGLFRSDHFTNGSPPDIESLELWTSLTWLASNTTRIVFGPLVTPFSFRHPVHTARMASAVDDLSQGRLVLGLGAGWNKREHDLFGFDLLEPKSRFDRFEEGMQVVTRLLQSDETVTFEGQFYHLRGATLLPRPARPGGPRILVGGNGVKRTLTYVTRYASEWNCVSLRPDKFSKLNARLSEMLVQAGREPASVRRSMMTGCVFGKDDAALNRKMRSYGKTLPEVQQGGAIAGSLREIRDQLQALEQAGLQRIMLQWLDLDDLENLEALAKGIL
ncbi:MAG TPA: TIGR03560 family F420-dependent LLM class oxidoreductase [Anaerolineales bacterium]|jgi:F420-dependent oxidoreductase-like protein|nr:TIGR03560 family F420-dependent LLM class oxidoreductase [Anaerolineales bacterium]